MRSPDNDLIIAAGHISVEYGSTLALDDVSFAINSGDFVAITGPNGGGKSTLLKTLLKLIKPTSGTVEYYMNGVPVESLHIGYLPQKSNIDNRFPITVEEVVASGLYGDSRNWRGKLMGVADLRKRVIGSLSGGQLQRTLLGRAVISDPEIVVLDEPLSYVDHNFIEQIYKIVEDISHHATLILVSHEMTVISEMANRHWIVDHTLHECHASHHYLKTECD